MQIKIAQKLRPYSHRPGTKCLLPGTTHTFEIFPACISTLGQEIPLPIEAPIREFTIEQNLENGTIEVWGQAANGYFRYKLAAATSGMGWKLIPEKGALAPIHSELETRKIDHTSIERLSLGSHKSLDWELMSRRQLLVEILPVWFRLGQLTPVPSTAIHKDSLLDQCLNGDLQSFLNLFNAGFDGILNPLESDHRHLGFQLPPVKNQSPLCLLSEGWKCIRSLFIAEQKQHVQVLPHLPPEFHCGRLLNVQLPIGSMDLEWSKKRIRRVVIRSAKDAALSLGFQKGLKHYRLRKNRQDKGSQQSVDQPLELQKNKEYYLDNFTA